MLSSTSFAVFETNLDSCPKCGKNICEHASVADVINLPNSLSQDFSTYSSDSSLIKQLLNESCSSTTNSSTNSTINFEPNISLDAINELFVKQKTTIVNKNNQKDNENLLNKNNNINCIQNKVESKKKKFCLFKKNRQLSCLSSSSSSSSSSSASSSSTSSSPKSASASSSTCSFNTANQPKTTYISVKLNSFYYYNYEKSAKVCKSSSSTASSTITDSVVTEIHRPLNSNVNTKQTNYCPNTDKESFTCSLSNDLLASNKHYYNNLSINNNYYHKITVIFVLIGLFSFNFLQETFLLIYYLNSNQTHWLFGSLIGIFTGQCLTLIVSFLAEINNTTNYKHILFKNPFSKLCLLIVPGYLPLSCFVQFFRLILNYKKSCAQDKFRLEFNLSLLFYFNSLFYTLPLIVVNSCYLSSQSRLNWYYADLMKVASSHDTTIMFIFSPDDARPRNQFMFLLLSIFVSVSIGLCLFITYYELMKQMRTFVGLKRFTPDTQWLRLGIIELLVYFCFKFCLITSRLCILALFWYLFNQLLLVFVCVHILILFVFNVNICFRQKKTTKQQSTQSLKPKSKLNDLITIKLVSILGLIDLFINQHIELNNTRQVFAYYLFNFVQNSLILTFWLVKLLYNEQTSEKIFYTTLIYLSVLLFNVFGLVLKYLHIHIIKKRYAKLFQIGTLIAVSNSDHNITTTNNTSSNSTTNSSTNTNIKQ